jgi:hypothetical protein
MMAMVLAMAIMMLAMVMVFMMVMKVLEAIRQVGWLHQRQHQSFHTLSAFY